MPKQNAPLLAFNRGIVSKKALGRIDIEALRFAAEQQTNFVPQRLGGMMLRPGFGYLLNTAAARPKYLPFVFGVDDIGLLEFTDGELRPIIDDAALTFEDVVAAVTNGDMEPNLDNWTDADDSGAASAYTATVGNVVNLGSRTVYDVGVGVTATAYYKLDADGIVYTKRDVLDGGVYQAVDGEWMLSGAAADYEHRVTVISGALSSGTAGTWLGGGTDREFSRARATNGTSTVVLLVETRLTGTTTTLAAGTITLKATRSSSGGGGGGIEP